VTTPAFPRMTKRLKAFIATLPQDGWTLDRQDDLRRHDRCPIEVAADVPAYEVFSVAAAAVGLSCREFDAVMSAADGAPSVVRRALLAHVGLTEAA
jgi:hypothetical protein